MPKARTVKLKSKKHEKEMNKVGDIMKSLLQTSSNSDDFSNIHHILDKYVNLRDLIGTYVLNITKLLVKVNSSHLNDQIRKYKEVIFGEYRKHRKFDVSIYQNTLDISTLEMDKLRTLRNNYIDLRDSFTTLTSIMVAKNILSCKLDKKSLNEKGKYEEFCNLAFKGDNELRIFNYIKIGEYHLTIDFDFCIIFNGSNVSMGYNDTVKREIFSIIISLCEIGRKVDKIKNSVDFDIDEMFPKLLEVLGSFKSQTRGCDRAFSIIENSADIFKKNSGKYIRKATKGGNPMSMFTDFVGDIIAENSSKVDSGETIEKPVMGELKKILREMRHKIELSGGAIGIPDNVKYIIDAADAIIEEQENNIEGSMPNIQEIRDRQRNFRDIFIP